MRGDVAFAGPNFLGFVQAVVVEGQGDLAMTGGGGVRRRRVRRPGEDRVQRALLELNPPLAQESAQTGWARLAQGLGRIEVADEQHGHVALPEVGETGGVAGEGGIEVLAQLTADRGTLVDEIAAMADRQLQFAVKGIAGRFHQGEAVDGGAMDGG